MRNYWSRKWWDVRFKLYQNKSSSWPAKITIQKRFRFQGHEDNPIWTLSRLVIWAILCEVEESLNLMGPCCASWGVPARGTSCRTFVNSYGLMHIPFVSDGNMTSARNLGCTRFGIDMRSSKAIGKYIHIALSHHIPSKDCSSTLPYPSKALLLVGGAACSITFSEVRSLRKILEPHMLCVLPKYFSWCIRFTSFCIFLKHINIYIYIAPAQAYVVKFWMQLHGGASPKRSVTYSNGSWISGLDLGVLRRDYRVANITLKSTRLLLRAYLHNA